MTEALTTIPNQNEISKTGAAEIRILPLTEEVIPSVVKIHREAFAGYMNTRLGRGYIEAFMNWFCQAEKCITLYAINNQNQPVGYALGAPVGWDREMNRDLFWIVARRVAIRPWLFLDAQFRRTIKMRLGILQGDANQMYPSLPEPTMSLVGIGVTQSARGLSCGASLMRAFEAKALELGARSMRLSVYPDNDVARRVYERSGWEPFRLPAHETDSMFYSKLLRPEAGTQTLDN